MPKNNVRVIEIVYVEELVVGANGDAIYELPLEFFDSIDQYSLNVDVEITGSSIPVINTDFVLLFCCLILVS